MTDEGLKQAALLIFMGLTLNGCLGSLSRTHIDERSIVDERELSKGMAEAACYLDGREWKYGECEATND